jgi:hypothetical protein
MASLFVKLNMLWHMVDLGVWSLACRECVVTLVLWGLQGVVGSRCGS